MKDYEIKKDNIYWFYLPGSSLMFPMSPPDIISVKCTANKPVTDLHNFTSWYADFIRTDNGMHININHAQYDWICRTREEAEKMKYESLRHFCKDIKAMQSQLKTMYREYKRLKKFYG